MSTFSQPFRIGSFYVRCFHGCTHAPAIHAELKRQHIDAAVVDHAFIVSPLQLAVAIFRVESNADFIAAPSTTTITTATSAGTTTTHGENAGQAALPSRKMSNSRRIFAALSLSHNLDRILQLLPPGPLTTSVVIVYRSSCAAAAAAAVAAVVNSQSPRRGVEPAGEEKERAIEAAIQHAVASTNAAAQEHSFDAVTAPFWRSAAVQYAEVAKVMEFYSVSETMLGAAQRSLTRREVHEVCAAAGGASGEEDQRRALRWYTLELCVVTQLAGCTA